ncbi:MAG: hypothetical protein KW793_03200 [Candidatus Doudnabacteria bacterium]|nr:hypothetical protein [Candidatus Doudnabacteria bacterium]
MEEKNWSFASVWNGAFLKGEDKPYEARDYLWASELGKSDVDLFLRLKGEQPTNKPDSRAHRKFEAGDVWEWIIKIILLRAGIYRKSQQPVKNALPEMLAVSGKLDHVAGGIPNFEQATEALDEMELPDVLKYKAMQVLQFLAETYPTGLKEKVLEIKSLGSIGFEKVMNTRRPLRGHDLQTFHYARGLNLPATIIYVCRDDARIVEIPIMPDDAELEAKYCERIGRITKCFREDIQPEPEPLIIFDENEGRFSLNFNIQYSSYLTKLYKFQHAEEYREAIAPLSERWNRVLGRIRTGKELTKNNLAALEEMKAHGFDADAIIAKVESMPQAPEEEVEATILEDK